MRKQNRGRDFEQLCFERGRFDKVNENQVGAPRAHRRKCRLIADLADTPGRRAGGQLDSLAVDGLFAFGQHREFDAG